MTGELPLRRRIMLMLAARLQDRLGGRVGELMREGRGLDLSGAVTPALRALDD